MQTISAACISSCRSDGTNLTNLLFAGQTLPETNCGLDGTPYLVHKDPNTPLIAAVFDAVGTGGARSSYFAANAFRTSLSTLAECAAPESLLEEIVKRLQAAQAPGLCAASFVIRGSSLSLADLGSCRAYLLRSRALYRLSAANGIPSGNVHHVRGALQPGDLLLICCSALDTVLSADELLRLLSAPAAPAALLSGIADRVRALGSGQSVTAVLLRVDP